MANLTLTKPHGQPCDTPKSGIKRKSSSSTIAEGPKTKRTKQPPPPTSFLSLPREICQKILLQAYPDTKIKDDIKRFPGGVCKFKFGHSTGRMYDFNPLNLQRWTREYAGMHATLRADMLYVRYFLMNRGKDIAVKMDGEWFLENEMVEIDGISGHYLIEME